MFLMVFWFFGCIVPPLETLNGLKSCKIVSVILLFQSFRRKVRNSIHLIFSVNFVKFSRILRKYVNYNEKTEYIKIYIEFATLCGELCANNTIEFENTSLGSGCYKINLIKCQSLDFSSSYFFILCYYCHI